jgi:hypothetical protein
LGILLSGHQNIADYVFRIDDAFLNSHTYFQK